MIDNYKIEVPNGTETKDITQIIGNLGWKSSLDTLGTELSFDKAHSDDPNFPNVPIDVGNIVTLSNNKKEIFRGIITDENISGRFSKSYIAFDFAFYLNKSKTIIQFNRIRADDAIRTLCLKFSIPIGNITKISTLIDTFYVNQTISEIIQDILAQATKELGIKYRLEMRSGKLHLEKYSDLIVKGFYKPSDIIGSFNVVNAIGSFSRSRSIVDMKNSILIISGDEKSSKIIAIAEDKTSQKKYGFLQEVESVDEKDIAQARNIANNRLNELNKILETNSIELLGSDEVMAGRILEIGEPITGMSGKYLVTECTHTYQNGIHRMSLNLEVHR